MYILHADAGGAVIKCMVCLEQYNKMFSYKYKNRQGAALAVDYTSYIRMYVWHHEYRYLIIKSVKRHVMQIMGETDSGDCTNK